MLGGAQWHIRAGLQSTGAELKVQAATLADIPLSEAVLIGDDGAVIKDDELPVSRSPPPPYVIHWI